MEAVGKKEQMIEDRKDKRIQMEGTQQSGIAFDLKIANLGQDGQLIQYVRDIAESILDNDPNLEQKENYLLAKQLKKISNKKVDFSVIS